MPHTCSTLLVHCVDFRFVSGLRKWMEEQKILGDCDVISVPGVVKALVNPQMPEDADFLLRSIGVGVNLHRVRRVILMNHLDCGAYGGARAFSSPQAEQERHSEDLIKAAGIVRERFAHIKVELALAKLNADGLVQIEIIEEAASPDDKI